jgi:CBS domain containing-hemolysin-like protein
MQLNQLKSQYAKTDQWIGKNITTKHRWMMNAAATAMTYVSSSGKNTVLVFLVLTVLTFFYGFLLEK